MDIEGFQYAPADNYRVTSGSLTAPAARIAAEDIEAYTLSRHGTKCRMLIFMK